LIFFHILYKGKRRGIQQSLAWQTEEQRNTVRKSTGNKKRNTKEGRKEREQEVTYVYNLNQSLPT